MSVRVCVLYGHGINADRELLEAWRLCGATPERVHVEDLFASPRRLRDYAVIAFPGGFSYGDHLGSGKVLAHSIRMRLKDALQAHIERDRLVIGICNGFQVLTRMGILPNSRGDWEPEGALIHNDSGTFIDKWVTLSPEAKNDSVWLQGVGDTDMPVRHGEGRFWVPDPHTLENLARRGLVAFRYSGDNPNGSQDAIAGITDVSGKVLGLMPHPEAFLRPENHPQYHIRPDMTEDGLELFRNAVRVLK